MQNSFSRKSVAAVTCVSFGVLGFAAPASADVTMYYEERVTSATWSPYYGTTYTVPWYSDFSFEVDLNGDVFNVGVDNAGDEDLDTGEFFTDTDYLADLKLRVNGLDKGDYTFSSEDFGSEDFFLNGDWNDYDNDEDDTDTVFYLENYSNISDFDYLDVFVDNDEDQYDGANLEFTLWRDTDGDDEIDGGEWKSATAKITWLGADEIKHTITPDLEFGSDEWFAEIAPNYNGAMAYEMGDLNTYAVLLRNGDPIDVVNVEYDSVDKYHAEAVAEDVFDAASYTVQTYVDADDEEDYDGYVDGATGEDDLLGSGSLRLSTPRVSYISGFGAVGTSNVTAEIDVLELDPWIDDETDEYDVLLRKGSTSATLEGYAYDEDDDAVGGAKLHVSLASWGLEEDTTVTINGKAYTGKAINEDEGIDEFPVTTDSKGRFSFTFSTSNTSAIADGEYLVFQVEEPGSAATDVDYAHLYWETASYKIYDILTSEQEEVNDEDDYWTESPTRSIEIGKTLEVTFAVVDQWGVGAPDGRSVKATRSPLAGNERTTTGKEAVWNANAEDEDTIFMTTKDGKVTLKVTDNGKGEGTDIVTVTGVSESISTPSNEFQVDYLEDTKVATMVVRTANDGVTDYYVNDSGWSEDSEDWGDAAAPIELQSISLVNWDERLNPGTAPRYEYDGAFDADGEDSDYVTSSVTVTDANGAPLKGVAVTWTGAGFAFEADGGVETYSVGSITMITDEDGEASVDVFGSRSGAQTVTITSGDKTATQTFTFEQKAAKDFTLTAPASSGPGKAVDVVVKMTDADGTTVSGAAITLASTGVGYLLNTSGTTTADGSYTTKLLLGSNDTGSAVISATATIGGKKVTKTVTVAVGPKVIVGSFQGRWAVRVQNAKGSTVSVRVAGKWVTFTPKTDNFLFSRPSVKGKSLAIGVWVDGTKRAAQTITVK